MSLLEEWLDFSLTKEEPEEITYLTQSEDNWFLSYIEKNT